MSKTVFLKIAGGPAHFIAEMAAMRDWLDGLGYSPSRFDCRKSAGTFLVSLDFSRSEQAEAFVQRFGHSQSTRTGLADHRDQPGKPHPGTIGQARSWRSIAQILRAKAEEFELIGQKRPWPALVEIAASYDDMAEKLERRLAKRVPLQEKNR